MANATTLKAIRTDQATLDRIIATAERELRVAEVGYSSLVVDAPLRDKVAAVERLRKAVVELDELRALDAE